MKGSRGPDIILEFASEIMEDFFAYDIDGEEPGSTFITWATFQKNHDCKRCAVRKKFRTAGG